MAPFSFVKELLFSCGRKGTWPPDLRVGGGREKEEEEEEGKGGQKNKRQVRVDHLGPGLLTCWRAGGERKKKKKKERRGERRKSSYVGFICVGVCEMARRQAPIFFFNVP